MAQDENINRLLKELEQKVGEVKELYKALETLKKYGAEISLPTLGSLFSSEGEVTSTRTDRTIRPDEFFGQTNTEAVERFLRKVGHGMPLDEIYAALIAGGARFSGDGKRTLNVQLTRATRKFAKIGSGQSATFGLLEFYPKRRKQVALEEVSDEEPSEEESAQQEPKEDEK